MIKFDSFVLDNGLRVYVNTDTSTPLVAMNILYKVGARDEDKEKTGFAHLFEHLMFGGSVNIPSYDGPLQRAGGENNAFTNNDITNYYLTLPAQNIETAFWLESDRMLNLAFSPKSLEVQRNVVIEEFRQRYLNQPYGDTWLLLRPLAYKVHPYQWPTIGKEVSHIENATLDDVKGFFKKFYHPANASLSLSGNIDVAKAKELCDKWFAPIPSGEPVTHDLPKEPEQEKKRILEVERDVPVDSIFKAWHCCARLDGEYHSTDLLTDILSSGKSSRFYNSLVRQKKIFTNVNIYMLGDIDNSLVVAEGRLVQGKTMQEAEEAITEEVNRITDIRPSDHELEKVKNKVESANAFGDMDIAHRALSICYYDMLGNAGLVNEQIGQYREVTTDDIINTARGIFREENSSVLYYHARN
jgi:predicted Zn-dependent peptidase